MHWPTASEKPTARNGILIVEDDPAIGELLVLALACQTPYRPVLASSEQEALHVLGMTGIEVYDHLHARNELTTVPAIVMGANLPRHELQERHLVGVEKPFALDDLLQTIEHVLASSSTPPG